MFAKRNQKWTWIILRTEEFSTKVTSGRWDEVLEEISRLSLSEAILIEIHEQVYK